MTIQIKNPPELNLNSIQEDFSLSALSTLHRYTFYCFIIHQHFRCFLLMCFKYLCPILKLRLRYYCKFNRIYSLHIANTCCLPFFLIRLVLFHLCGKLLGLFYCGIDTIQYTKQQLSLCLKRFLYQLCL